MYEFFFFFLAPLFSSEIEKITRVFFNIHHSMQAKPSLKRTRTADGDSKADAAGGSGGGIAPTLALAEAPHNNTPWLECERPAQEGLFCVRIKVSDSRKLVVRLYIYAYTWLIEYWVLHCPKVLLDVFVCL